MKLLQTHLNEHRAHRDSLERLVKATCHLLPSLDRVEDITVVPNSDRGRFAIEALCEEADALETEQLRIDAKCLLFRFYNASRLVADLEAVCVEGGAA